LGREAQTFLEMLSIDEINNNSDDANKPHNILKENDMKQSQAFAELMKFPLYMLFLEDVPGDLDWVWRFLPAH
jgi:hypothetical protein